MRFSPFQCFTNRLDIPVGTVHADMPDFCRNRSGKNVRPGIDTISSSNLIKYTTVVAVLPIIHLPLALYHKPCVMATGVSGCPADAGDQSLADFSSAAKAWKESPDQPG